MKNYSNKFIVLLISILVSTFYSFSQQSSDKPKIKSILVDFSDIVKYDIQHPNNYTKTPENEFDNEEEEISKQNIIPSGTHGVQDPFGKMNSKGIIIPTALTPAPSIDFNAIDNTNGISVPDLNGAVGPNHVMTTLNTDVRIQNLNGGIIKTVTLNSFWGLLGSIFAFDPKIVYEPFNNRWIFTAVANYNSPNAALLIGVSRTNDPTGKWSLYSLDIDANNINWLDYPSLGYNKNWIVVSGTIVGSSGGSRIYVFKKADLYNNNSSPSVTVFNLNYGSSISPVVTLDNNLSTEYLLQSGDLVYDDVGIGNRSIALLSIAGSFGSETLSRIDINTTNLWMNSASGTGAFSNIAPQQGSALKFFCADGRMQNSVYRNGSIWGVHTVFLDYSLSTEHSAIQWWQLSPSGGIVQRGRIEDPTGAVHYAYPSIAVNSSNYALIGCSKFSSSIYASGCYALRAPSDAINTFQSEYIFKAGQAKYFIPTADSVNRWGDYTATMTNPGGLDFWTLQEYAHTPVDGTDKWGTWWAKVATSWDTCLTVVNISASPANVICSGTNVTFMAAPTNGGTSPSYQWKKNGSNVGTNSNTYTSNSLSNGDQITCVLTSNHSCATGNPATSNTIIMTVNNIDDGTVCTADVCNYTYGTVTHTALFTDDGFPCTSDGCNSITGVFHTPVNCGPTLNANIFLQGFYSGSGLMANHDGTGLLYAYDGVAHPDPTDMDTVFVSAMNTTFPYEEVFRQSVVLKTNGNVTVIFGPAVITGNSYYIKVNHRNSVETWSASPVQLNSTTSYSFSSSASQTYGSNETLTYDNLYYAIYSGDINQDGAIDATDFLILDADIGNGDFGYIPTDLNGDVAVDASDFLVLDPNVQNGVGAVTP